MSIRDEFEGLWRASACEMVKYTEDFPETLLVLLELLDGAIGQGKSKKVTIEFIWITPTSIRVRVIDDGKGIQDFCRFLTWAAPSSVDNLHRNGHGSKKALTKFAPDYNTAKWRLGYRNPGTSLMEIHGPFMGLRTEKKVIQDDTTSLMPSGTEFSIDCESTVLKTYDDPKKLMKALEDLICSRYSDKYLEETEFILHIENSFVKYNKTVSSHTENWKSFEYHVNQAVVAKQAILTKCAEHPISGGKWVFTGYKLTVSGHKKFYLKDKKYGQKNMDCARLHISIDGRMIEAMHIYRLMDRESNHNDFNGHIGFVNFIPNTKEDFNKLPEPCTTKVSFNENNEVFTKFKEDFKKTYSHLYKKDAKISSASSITSDSESNSEVSSVISEVFKTKPSGKNPIVRLSSIPAPAPVTTPVAKEKLKKPVKVNPVSVVNSIITASKLPDPDLESVHEFTSITDVIPDAVPLVLEPPPISIHVETTNPSFGISVSNTDCVFVKDSVEICIPCNSPDLLQSYFLANTTTFTQESIHDIALYIRSKLTGLKQ